MTTLAIIAIIGGIAVAFGFTGIIFNMAGMAKNPGNTAGFSRHVYLMLPIFIGMLMVAGSGITFAVQLLQKVTE